MSVINLPENQPDSNEQLGDEITLLAGQINAATYRFLKLIAEFDRREAWNGGDIRSCAHWLNWKCGIAIGAAREKVRVARCLENLPQINEAFSKGLISFSKVRAMTRVADDENEDYLLMIAEHGTASHMEKLVGKFQSVENRLKPDQEQAQQDGRKMVSYQDESGMWHIHATLPAEEGALVVKAIDAIVFENKEAENKENVSAETSTEEQDNASNEYPFAKKRVDALTMLAEHYLATATNSEGMKSLAGNERCQVMLHVDMKTLQLQQQQHSHHHCNLENKHWVSPETARRLSCDASLITVLEGEQGNILNIGRRSRTIPPAINRALRLRDTTCQHPGCCTSNHLDAHHIKHWADGGDTSLDNLVLLCRSHHTGLHKGKFNITLEQSQPVFTLANGQVIKRNHMGHSASREITLGKMWPSINKNTAVTKWKGEKMDYGMGVIGLLPPSKRN